MLDCLIQEKHLQISWEGIVENDMYFNDQSGIWLLELFKMIGINWTQLEYYMFPD